MPTFSFTVPTSSPTAPTVGNLCDAVDLLASGVYPVTRYAATTRVNGRVQPASSSGFNIIGSAQPIQDGLKNERVPEGHRNREAMKLFTCTQLFTSENGKVADTLVVDGFVFEVSACERWAQLGNFYRCIITKRPSSTPP